MDAGWIFPRSRLARIYSGFWPFFLLALCLLVVVYGMLHYKFVERPLHSLMKKWLGVQSATRTHS